MGFYNTENWPEKRNYYRWPWSSNDNPVQWLEVTDVCNMHCKGCYRSYMVGHRPVSTLKEEVEFCIRMRNIDTVCIAGGEPLIHPDIVELVRYIAGRKLKPNIITNTHAMTPQLVRDLWKAGLYGFTCHIDMMQERPGTPRARSEVELEPLRQRVADMVHEVTGGRVYLTFNMTIYHENFRDIPEVVRWAHRNVPKVCGLDFITYRGIPVSDDVKWETGEAPEGELGYAERDRRQIDITSVDVYNLLKDNFGELYEPAGYLGGTGRANEYKWFGQAALLERNGKMHGSAGSRTFEFLQMTHHWFRGRYFMYLRSRTTPRIAILATALLGDRAMARTRRRVALSLLNPVNWFRPLYTQSIGINQPPDLLDNGMGSMCESCPDACVHGDSLVSSCRWDEYRKYGRLLSTIEHTSDSESDKRVPVGARE